MNITLRSGGLRHSVQVPPGTTLADVREMNDDLEEVGAPSEYDFTVGGEAKGDDYVLQEGDTVSFRPVTGDKG